MLELDYTNVLESVHPNATIKVGGTIDHVFRILAAYAGEFYVIDAFDQPGVEYGKKLTFAMMGRPGFDEYHRKIEEIRQRGRSVIR